MQGMFDGYAAQQAGAYQQPDPVSQPASGVMTQPTVAAAPCGDCWAAPADMVNMFGIGPDDLDGAHILFSCPPFGDATSLTLCFGADSPHLSFQSPPRAHGHGPGVPERLRRGGHWTRPAARIQAASGQARGRNAQKPSANVYFCCCCLHSFINFRHAPRFSQADPSPCAIRAEYNAMVAAHGCGLSDSPLPNLIAGLDDQHHSLASSSLFDHCDEERQLIKVRTGAVTFSLSRLSVLQVL